MKKLVTWLAIAFVAYCIYKIPEEAARITRSAGEALGNAASSLATFVGALVSHPDQIPEQLGNLFDRLRNPPSSEVTEKDAPAVERETPTLREPSDDWDFSHPDDLGHKDEVRTFVLSSYDQDPGGRGLELSLLPSGPLN